MLSSFVIAMMCFITLAMLPTIINVLIYVFICCVIFISALWSLTFISVAIADKFDYLDILPPFIAEIFIQIITLGGLL